MSIQLQNIKSFLGRNYHNSKGWSTKRKIIVIESDDWGSIRMPSKDVYLELLNKGIDIDKCPFSRFDSLASEEDLNELFEILLKHKDRYDRHPGITANTIVANPDFKKIKESNFKYYYFEKFTETLNRYPAHSKSFDLWQKGMDLKIFHPQYHGREHVHVGRWLSELNNNNRDIMLAFEINMFGLSRNLLGGVQKSLMEALDLDNIADKHFIKNSLIEGFDLFYEVFGYKPLSFIATNYVWDEDVEKALSFKKIKYIQSVRNQLSPILGNEEKKRIKHFIGEKNKFGQTYLIRNCIFEPSTTSDNNDVSKCLSQIKTSFKWNKPAIISTHRLNFIGFIEKKNREDNLKLFDKLLSEILKKWPTVEFMTSDELGNLITNQE